MTVSCGLALVEARVRWMRHSRPLIARSMPRSMQGGIGWKSPCFHQTGQGPDRRQTSRPGLTGLFIRDLALVCSARRGAYFALRAPFSKFLQGACPLCRYRVGAAPPLYQSQAERFSERLLRPLRNPHGTKTDGSRVCPLDNVPTILDAANIRFVFVHVPRNVTG